MQQGLFLFTGPDGYFLDIELKKRQQNFAEKFWKDNILVFTEDTITVEALQEWLQWGWLFATKKLVICKWIPEDKTVSGKSPIAVVKFLEQFLGGDDIHMSPDIILVFVSIDPDKRLKLFKILSEKATVKSFPALSDWQLVTFLQQKLWIYFSQDLAQYMIAYVDNNLFRLESEADKIVTYLTATGKTTLTDIERDAIIYTPIQINAFDVLDALLANDIKKANRLIDDAAIAMTPRPEYLWMLYWGLKHMILTVDIYRTWITSSKDIAAKIGMHFFPIAKNLKYIATLQAKEKHLHSIFHALLDLDKNIKSWFFPQEWFWVEVKTIINTHWSA